MAAVSDLARQYLCADMTEKELEPLKQLGDERRFSGGTRIFSAGDTAASMFFIYDGEVALLNERQRTANVVAAVDTVCLEVCFDALEEAMRTKILVNMASYFARKIEQDTDLMTHLG